MIKRKNEQRIKEFFEGDHRALLVEGARQTGKTFTIREIGKNCFEQFVEINFYEQPDASALFSSAKSAEDLLLRISSLTKKKLVPGKTLIFFDEVQECKEIVTAIKFLVDEGSYRYVLSGSLLGVALKDIRSIPVGYMSVIDMYPLDLEEFALAVGVSDDIIQYIEKCYDDKTQVDTFVHSKMLELVQLYLIIGGMPAAVQKYVDTNNLRSVAMVQRDIIRLYRADISKYDFDHKLQIEEIFNLIPSELNAKNKRFILKNLNENKRFNALENSFVWLKDAGVAIPTYNIEEPRVPLLLNKQHNLFKMFLADVGLLACMYAGDIQKLLLQNITNINYGGIYENFVAQELCAHGFSQDGNNLYYFNSKKQGELDFVIECKGNVMPIEVKSGKDYHRHNALSNVMTSDEYVIPEAIVFCQGNVEKQDKTTYLPIYMTMFLKKQQLEDTIYKFNLSGLTGK